MPDFLMYWKYFWRDEADDPDSFNDNWHTQNEHFFNKVEQGDSLWVVISGGRHYPAEWRLLQRIIVQEKFADYDLDRPYGITGNVEQGQKFDIATQSDLTPVLHRLEFVSGKKITATGKAIGNTLQAIRPLAKSDSALLRRYALNLARHWLDVTFNVASLEGQIRAGAGFGDPETNRKVESAAISLVSEWYESRGWKVESVEAEKCGYDLRCRKGSTERNVEVKGVQRASPSFIITAAEVKQAQSNSNFVLCVVTSALSGKPKLYSYVGTEFIDNFDMSPLTYRAILRA